MMWHKKAILLAMLGLTYKARDGGDWRDAEIMTTKEVPTIKLLIPISALSCPFCLRPLKPPLYKCKGKHQVACADFRGERQCQECDADGGFNMHSTFADALYTNIKAECWHEGCGLNVSYYNLEDHHSTCPFAPCKCYVPGCRYEGPPPALTHHLSTVHLMPEHRIQYGKVLQLQVPVSELRRLLLAEEDGHAFFVVGGALGMNAPITVSIICIRAGASQPPYYAAKVWANGPLGANGRTDTVELEIEVTSSKEPGAIAVEELTFLTVPPTMLAGAGSSRTVSLHIRIDNLTS